MMHPEEYQLHHTDVRYRNYVSLVEKALKSFEYTNEWADLISALAKLTKVIASHKKYNVLPKKVTVGKRLAQCVHPALPAGVHLKALELYETIFTTIDNDILVKDFSIYSAGLLPLLSHASMTVKPVLLKLYEDYILPLAAYLKPAAAGIILGLLPGLEEGSEFFDRTSSLCERFADTFGLEHFYTSFWTCMLGNPSIRLAGTTFLLAHIEKDKSMEDQLFLLGHDINLLVNALKDCLEDTAVLVQRNTLDILTSAFHFHGSPLSKADQSELLSSALLVLLRRDMSLNRRLYGWLLGITTTGTRIKANPKPMAVKQPDEEKPEAGRQRRDSGSSSASEPELEYFNIHSKRYLVHSLRRLLDSVTDADSDVIKPFRIVISLLDRVEIGSAILEDILVNVFKLLRRCYCSHLDLRLPVNNELCTYRVLEMYKIDLDKATELKTSVISLSHKTQSELIKTCNLLFGTLEPPYLWQYIADTYEKTLWPSEIRQQEMTITEFCDMVSMVLSIVSLETYVETKTAYLPQLLNNMVVMLKENIKNVKLADQLCIIHLARRIVHLCLPTSPIAEEGLNDPITVHDSLVHIQSVLEFILSEPVPLDLVKAKLEAFACCSLLIIEISSFPVFSSRDDGVSVEGKSDQGHVKAGEPSWIQSLVFAAKSANSERRLQHIAISSLMDLINLADLSAPVSSGCSNLSASESLEKHADCDIVKVKIFAPISRTQCSALRNELDNFFACVWSAMNADQPVSNQESVFLLASLLKTTNNSLVMERTIIKELVDKIPERKVVGYKKFALFWHLTRDIRVGLSSKTHNILMVVLASLLYENELVQEIVHEWITHAVQSNDVNRIIEPLLVQLLDADTSRTSYQQKCKLDKPAPDQQETEEEINFKKSMEAAQKRIKAIGSDGQIVVKHGELDKVTTQVRNTVITKEGHISPLPAVSEPLDYESYASYGSAGLALNPFGDVSELDHLIFEGFTPHKSLNSKWMHSVESPSDDYHSIIAKAKRLDRDICEREGISFSIGSHGTEKAQSEVDLGSQPMNSVKCGKTAIPMGPPKSMKPGPPEPPPLIDPEVEILVKEILGDILDDIIDSHTSDQSASPSLSSSNSAANMEAVKTAGAEDSSKKASGTVPPTKSAESSQAFILIYDQFYDTNRVQFALTILQRLLNVSQSLMISSLTSSTCKFSKLLSLIVRHSKALSGENFFLKLTQDDLVAIKNVRLIEVMILICTYFWRSYHSVDHAHSGCTQANSLIQLQAVDLLTMLLNNLDQVLGSCPKGFPHYMMDLLARSKVQKTCLLHLQSLHGRSAQDLWDCGAVHDKSVDHAMLLKNVRLAAQLLSLESKLQQLHYKQIRLPEGSTAPLLKKNPFNMSALSGIIIRSIKDHTQAHLHHHWLELVANTLTSLQVTADTCQLVTHVVDVTCQLFISVSKNLMNSSFSINLPPDYVPRLLENFTVICHFCFMDDITNPTRQTILDDAKNQSVSTGQIFTNLVSVFNPLSASTSSTKVQQAAKDAPEKEDNYKPRNQCRDQLLSRLPKILASMSMLWRVHQQLDDVKVVRLVVEFFSPVLHNYTEQLLGSVAVVWSDSQDVPTSKETQETLIELLLSIKALPMDSVVEKLSSVIRKPPNTDHMGNAKVVLQISCIRFLRGYIAKIPTIPKNSLPSLSSLLKNCLLLSLPATGVLLLMETVNDLIMKFGNIEDRKMIKEMQEIVGKVIEACCLIASAQLETSSWAIRKNYTVKIRAPVSEPDLNGLYNSEQVNGTAGIKMDDQQSTEAHEHEYTSAALSLLAEATAGLLDVVYPSEDKEKVTPVLTSLLARVFPYLKNHSLLNMSCFRACSKLLASLSSYQYTRRTWRREAYDILLLQNFFQMDVSSLQHWKVLVDNLMTPEKTLFKELLGRYAITSNSSIPLFSNKDSEALIKAQNLKKLTFIIYSGDVDNYKEFMPDIQERLAENLRLMNCPVILSQVFLCFRVLLLKMSPSCLTLLWPNIITELVHSMTQIEQDLAIPEEEEAALTGVNELDAGAHLKDLGSQSKQAWLLLYLSACKLLDLLLALPPSHIPEFQHYTWMFTGYDESSIRNKEKKGHITSTCLSHVPSILKLMALRFGTYGAKTTQQNRLILHEQSISSLKDLQPFFTRLMVPKSCPTSLNEMCVDAQAVIDNDFIEALS